jgi:hypothetical protein
VPHQATAKTCAPWKRYLPFAIIVTVAVMAVGGGAILLRSKQQPAPEVKQRLGVVRAELPDHRDNIFAQPAGAKRRELLGARHQNRAFMRKAAV